MWLINTDSLELKYFANPREGSYAVLSHTWGPEEMSFQQFSDRTSARDLPGFAKIEKSCQLAREKYMLEYAWVDTCCIDKTSSAELSEAINSMFRWYQQAHVCFVYLSDMPVEPGSPADGPLDLYKSIIRKRLKGCKWFSRGWTLQELLAPRIVEFYDGNWDFIGTKDSWLLDTVSNITGIDPVFLKHGYLIWSAPVATRMRWAAERETSRPEDMAYCLLGIFEINMPMLYGEGSKAFLRLQEEICKQTNDLSLFAWTTQPGYASSLFDKYRGIFATHPCEFVAFRELARDSGRSNLRNEFAVTNKGLRLDGVQLYKAPDDTLILPLGCVGPHPEDASRSVSYGIYLILTLDGYIRREPDVLAVLSDDCVPSIPPHRIYVMKQLPIQWPNSQRLQDQYDDALVFDFRGQFSTRIVNVIPRESFDHGLTAFLTGGKKFFGYLRLSVGSVEIVIICWLKTPPSKETPAKPPKVRYSFVVEGEDGWDKLKIMRLEAEVTNHGVQDGIIPSLLPTPMLSGPDGRIVVSLGSSGINMVMETSRESEQHCLVVTFLNRTTVFVERFFADPSTGPSASNFHYGNTD